MRLSWLSKRRPPARSRALQKGLPRLAVVGALRSGTNLVRQVVETHWEASADFSPYGWKHAGVPILSPDCGLNYPDVPILFVVKNPYASVLSLFRYRMLATSIRHQVSIEGSETLERFLTEPVTVFDTQLPGSPRLRFANPVQYWNFVYCNLETLEPSVFHARGLNYEDLLADPARLRIVEELVNLRRRKERITLPSEPAPRDVDTTSMRAATGTGRFDALYYSECRYLKELTPGQIAFIGDQADPWLMQRRAYPRY
jgi:hypothetical protein